MDDLTAFITARLDEDEATAKQAASPSLHDLSWTVIQHPGEWAIVADAESDTVAVAQPERSYDSAVADHIARHDPARTLREITAKRAHLAEYESAISGCLEWGVTSTLENILYSDAAVWSDHPDYKATWAT